MAQRQLGRFWKPSALISVRQVFRHYGVSMKDIQTPNDTVFLDKLKTNQPDVIFCAVPNILKAPILSLPTLACVNRHAGQLPYYRGLEPVFQALRQGELHVTVTYHTMVQEIDGGTILWEHHEPVTLADTVYTLYARLFQVAALGFWQSLDNLEAGVGQPIKLNEGTYFSEPTDEQIAEFRRQGRRYI